MGESTARGAAKTKDALADALIELLTHEQPLGKVRIKQLTDLCGVDRQTFYYYFKNISELIQYAYEREVERMLSDKGIADIQQLDWKTRICSTLKLIQENPGLRKMITSSLSDRALRLELRNLIWSELEQTFLPHLLEAGMEEKLAQDRLEYLSYMFESVLMSWLNSDIEKDPADILNHIEEMLIDYSSGVRVRLLGNTD